MEMELGGAGNAPVHVRNCSAGILPTPWGRGLEERPNLAESLHHVLIPGRMLGCEGSRITKKMHIGAGIPRSRPLRSPPLRIRGGRGSLPEGREKVAHVRRSWQCGGTMKACWHGGVLRLRLGGACAVKQGREKVAHVRHGWQCGGTMETCGGLDLGASGEDDHAISTLSAVLRLYDAQVA